MHEITVWFQSPLEDIFADTQPGGNAQGRIRMLRNECENCQLGIRSDEELTNLEVSAALPEQAAAVIRAMRIRLLYSSAASYGLLDMYDTHADYIRARPPCSLPECYEAARLERLPAGTSLGICVEIEGDEQTRPGRYEAQVAVHCDQGRAAAVIDVEIVDACMPAPRDSAIGYTNWGVFYAHERVHKPYWDMMERAYRVGEDPEKQWTVLRNILGVMKKQRQNTLLVPVWELLIDRMDIDEKGAYHFDFTAFDRFVETALACGSIKFLEGDGLCGQDWVLEPPPKGEWPKGEMSARIPVKQDGGIGFEYVFVERQAERFLSHIEQYLKQLYAHLVERGWDRLWLQHVTDEPLSEIQWREASDVYRRIRQWMPTVKTFDAGSDQNTHFGGEVQIPVPQIDSYERNRADFQRMQHTVYEDLWVYTCINPQGNYFTRLGDYPLISARIIGWYLYKRGLGGYLHWAWNYWLHSATRDPYTDVYCHEAVCDAFLVYPDGENLSVKEGPRATAVRDGFEDYELIRLAAAKDRARTDAIVDQAIEDATHFVREPARLLALRGQLLDIVKGNA